MPKFFEQSCKDRISKRFKTKLTFSWRSPSFCYQNGWVRVQCVKDVKKNQKFWRDWLKRIIRKLKQPISGLDPRLSWTHVCLGFKINLAIFSGRKPQTPFLNAVTWHLLLRKSQIHCCVMFFTLVDQAVGEGLFSLKQQWSRTKAWTIQIQTVKVNTTEWSWEYQILSESLSCCYRRFSTKF